MSLYKKSFENIVGKKKKMLLTKFANAFNLD